MDSRYGPRAYGSYYGYQDPYGDYEQSPTYDSPPPDTGSGNPYTEPAPPPPTAPTPDPTPSPNPTQSGTPYSDQAFQAILRKYQPTQDGIRQAVAEANRTFGTNISIFGSKGEKLVLPDGRRIDSVIGMGTGNGQWGWQDITNGEGGGGGGGLDGGGLDPALLQPFTEQTPTAPQQSPFIAPTPYTEARPEFAGFKEFQAPTGQTITGDPSFQFRMDQGRKVLENSAAARGVLNSGGTLADIINYGQKAASQEYSNVWDRSFGVWNADAMHALDDYRAKSETWDRGFNLWNAQYNNDLSGYRANTDSMASNYDRLMSGYRERKDTFYQNQNNPFDKLYRTASLGASAG